MQCTHARITCTQVHTKRITGEAALAYQVAARVESLLASARLEQMRTALQGRMLYQTADQIKGDGVSSSEQHWTHFVACVAESSGAYSVRAGSSTAWRVVCARFATSGLGELVWMRAPPRS